MRGSSLVRLPGRLDANRRANHRALKYFNATAVSGVNWPSRCKAFSNVKLSGSQTLIQLRLLWNCVFKKVSNNMVKTRLM